MKVALLLLCCCVAAALTHPHGVEVEDNQLLASHGNEKANMNEYFDAVLEQAKIYMRENNMVPYQLPDSLNGFCVRWFWIDYHGELYLTDGWLTDLTSISRRGDTELLYGDRIMTIKAVVGFDLLQMTYDYLAKIMGIGPDGGVIGTIKDVTYDIEIVINLDTAEAHVESLKVLSTGSLDVKLTGTIILDVIANAIADVIVWLFKDTIMVLITFVVKLAINSALAGMGGPPPTSAPAFF